METTVQRLRYVLDVLEPAVAGKKATLPILQNVVVGRGRAYAQNLETAITVEFPEATDDPLLVPHQQLLSLLRHIPSLTRLTINREGRAIKLLAGATKAEFPVPGEVKDFPPVPSFQPIGEGQVDGDLFLKTATTLAVYAATDTGWPALKCVCVTLGAPLEMASADGFRLAWEIIPMALPGVNSPPIDLKHLLLPTTAVDALARVWKVIEKEPTVDAAKSADPLKQDGGFRMAMLAVAKRLATIRFTQDALSFEHGAVTIRVRLTHGEFPNYHALIPADLPNKVSFDAEAALRAVRSLQNVAAEGSDILRLAWYGDILALSAKGEEAGTISASIRAHIQGEGGTIAFKIGYLLEYLHGKLGMVLMETLASKSPARFFHSGSPDVLLMPMFVSDPAEPATEQNEDVPADEVAFDSTDANPGGPAPEPASEPAPAAAKSRARARRVKR